MWPFSTAYPEVRAAEVDGQTFDYVVIGAGTGGCVVASALTERANGTIGACKVLVVEKGEVRDNWVSRVPFLSSIPFLSLLQPVLDRFTEPLPNSNRRLQLISADAVGGTSRINGMQMTRCVPGAYNEWAQDLGLTDWSWEHVEPYFKAVENAASAQDDPTRGHQGSMRSVQTPAYFSYQPYIPQICSLLGLPVQQSLNNPNSPAQGQFQTERAMDENGRRVSTYTAFLNKKVVLERKDRLVVCTGTIATKLDIDQTSGTVLGVYLRATGKKKNRDVYVKVAREVILCSGALRTPQLLMLSGVGPEAHLKALDISVVRDLPVGQGLKDHIMFPIMQRLAWFDTMHALQRVSTFMWNLVAYLFQGRGLLSTTSHTENVFVKSSNLDEKGVFKMRNDPGDGQDVLINSDNDALQPGNVPDIEIMVNAVNCLGDVLNDKDMLSWIVGLVQPHSVGSMELVSTDAEAHMRIHYPFFTDDRDLIAARKATRFALRLAYELENSGYPHPISLFMAPGVNLHLLLEARRKAGGGPSPPNPVPRSDGPASPIEPSASNEIQVKSGKYWETVTDKDVDDYIFNVGMSTMHYGCTCRMSVDPQDGVVDQKLRVHGIKNLRIADASIFPKIPSAHPMLPILMVAKRCADFIIKDELEVNL